MFRIVLECKYINVDTVLGNLIDMVKRMQDEGLLNNLPGNMKIPSFVNASMFQSLADEQKLNLIATGINQEKGKVLPMLENLASAKIGAVELKDISMKCNNTAECMAAVQIDVEQMEEDKVLDLLIDEVLREEDIVEILGENYDPNLNMENIAFFMHGQPKETREYLALRTMSVEKRALMQKLEDFAKSKEVELTMANMRFLMK